MSTGEIVLTPLQLRVHPHRRVRRNPRRRVQRVAVRRLHLLRVGRAGGVRLHTQGGRRRQDRRLQNEGVEEKGETGFSEAFRTRQDFRDDAWNNPLADRLNLKVH